ncbi:hypothetical protein A3Q56_06385 [Intoshia linei]|uniref:UPAR/Ly6 domain-containing protein n=1 Tax=Intoshia linei TaxID=1819745 RepID=A0A177AVM7_9BILA|nr:hypothetical protein A3Q56_06385 [Intoshia linei]
MLFNTIFLALCVLGRGGVNCLSCYKCTNQTNNYGNCIAFDNVECLPQQEACATYVRYEEYDRNNLVETNRYYLISKGCDVLSRCIDREKEMKQYCIKKPSTNWHCFTCCQKSLCNYYVPKNDVYFWNEGNRAVFDGWGREFLSYDLVNQIYNAVDLEISIFVKYLPIVYFTTGIRVPVSKEVMRKKRY